MYMYTCIDVVYCLLLLFADVPHHLRHPSGRPGSGDGDTGYAHWGCGFI